MKKGKKMRYHIGDKFVLSGIECKVAHINAYGHACLVPEVDGDVYNKQYTMIGLVFAIVDEYGRDKLGNRVYPISNRVSGAV